MKLIDHWVYAVTKKPKHYVDLRHPPKTALEKLSRPQDARQMQYNRWCRRFRIYSGSYLPTEPERLLKKGWEDKTEEVTSQPPHETLPDFYRRKSTSQWVRFDHDKKPWHWHWYRCWSKKLDKVFLQQNESTMYYDRYGNECGRNDPSSHLERRK